MSTEYSVKKEVSEAYKKYKFKLIKDTAKYLINKNQIEDCIQDTFIVFQSKLMENDGPVESTYGFLKAVAKNIAIKYNRMDERVVVVEDLPEVEDNNLTSAESALIQNETLHILMDSLDELQPRARNALIYHHAYKNDFKSTAKILGSTESAAQKLVGRGLKELQGIYNKKIGG